MIGKIRKKLTMTFLNRKWRKLNANNKTYIVHSLSDSLFPIDKVSVGNFTYGGLLVYTFGSNDEDLKIGNYCSIGRNVRFILGGMHHMNTLSTYPFKVHIMGGSSEAFSKGPIVIEDDVWIGNDVLILSGCTIAKGSVIAAGSVVVNSTEPYSIVGGNPAKLIRKRFDQSIIDELINLDITEIIPEIIKSHKIDLLYTNVDLELIKEFKKCKITKQV